MNIALNPTNYINISAVNIHVISYGHLKLFPCEPKYCMVVALEECYIITFVMNLLIAPVSNFHSNGVHQVFLIVRLPLTMSLLRKEVFIYHLSLQLKRKQLRIP